MVLAISLVEFWEKLAASRRRILLLDYDGTLAPFHIDRNKAMPYPRIRESLNSILQLSSCRVVIVSGRWTKDLLPLLRLRQQPEIWGSHGLERLYPDGTSEIVPLEERVIDGLARADTWMKTQELQDFCEQKPGCLALHWRGLPQERVDRLKTQVNRVWSRLGKETGLELNEFDGGLELRAPSCNKGNAVTTILQEENPGAMAAYLGDDHTDEDAFAAIAGKGLGVLVRREKRPSVASVWLKPPEQLLHFLRKWIEVCRA